MLVLHAFELYTKQIIQYVFFDLLFLPLNVPFVPFVPAVACSCMTFYHGTTLSFSSPFSSQQMFGLFGVFLLLQAVSLGTFLQATLGATVKRFSGVISGSKVYTFAPCLDNTDLFSQGVPSFPPGPKPHPHNIPLRHLSDLLERGFEAGPERNLSICTALAPTLCTRGDNMAWEI